MAYKGKNYDWRKAAAGKRGKVRTSQRKPDWTKPAHIAPSGVNMAEFHKAYAKRTVTPCDNGCKKEAINRHYLYGYVGAEEHHLCFECWQ